MRDLVISLFFLVGQIAKQRKPRLDASLHSIKPRGAKELHAIILVLLFISVIGEWLRPRVHCSIQPQFEYQSFERRCSRWIAKNA